MHQPPEQLSEQGVEQSEDKVYDEETVKFLAHKTLPALERTAQWESWLISTGQHHTTL